MIPLLEDILYPNEKECFCTKYRIGFVRIGEAVRGLHPKSKAIVLSAIRQSGFTKEDLRELNWTFSSHLWNVGNFALPGRCFILRLKCKGAKFIMAAAIGPPPEQASRRRTTLTRRE